MFYLIIITNPLVIKHRLHWVSDAFMVYLRHTRQITGSQTVAWITSLPIQTLSESSFSLLTHSKSFKLSFEGYNSLFYNCLCRRPGWSSSNVGWPFLVVTGFILRGFYSLSMGIFSFFFFLTRQHPPLQSGVVLHAFSFPLLLRSAAAPLSRSRTASDCLVMEFSLTSH
jgi:hypothetical protein